MAKRKRKKSGPGRSDRVGISIEQMLEMFPDEASAVRWFENIRWGEGRYCPHCGGMDTYRTKSAKPQPYRCRDCKSYFSIRTGTAMSHSKLPMRTWAIGVYLMSTSLKGVPSMKLHRDLGITQKNAWFMAHRIREGWRAAADDFMLDDVVEADETYVGGLEKNKHWDKKQRLGRGAVGKAIVVGVRSRRGNKVRAEVVENTRRATLHDFVRRHVEPGSVVYTDEAPSYEGMPEYFHQSVNHSRGQYVDGDAHTNSIESFWAPIKRSYKGTYHKISPKRLHRYVAEFVGHHNWRSFDTIDLMTLLVLGMEKRRLTWKELTK